LEVVAAVELAVLEDPAEAPVAEAVEPEPEPLAAPDGEEPVPVGALPEAVGVAAALAAALLMQLSTQD